jgi:hypothetical protein
MLAMSRIAMLFVLGFIAVVPACDRRGQEADDGGHRDGSAETAFDSEADKVDPDDGDAQMPGHLDGPADSVPDVAQEVGRDMGQPGTPEGGTGLEPIRVSGGPVDAGVTYYDLRFVGVGLDQYDGAVVTFRVGSTSGANRRGSGQVRIVQGGFDVLFPGVLPPVYEGKLAHIDANENGACEVGEPSFYDSGLFLSDVTLTVTPTDIRFRPAVSGWCDAVANWPDN